jgi:hypothetical protein
MSRIKVYDIGIEDRPRSFEITEFEYYAYHGECLEAGEEDYEEDCESCIEFGSGWSEFFDSPDYVLYGKDSLHLLKDRILEHLTTDLDVKVSPSAQVQFRQLNSNVFVPIDQSIAETIDVIIGDRSHIVAFFGVRPDEGFPCLLLFSLDVTDISLMLTSEFILKREVGRLIYEQNLLERQASSNSIKS